MGDRVCIVCHGVHDFDEPHVVAGPEPVAFGKMATDVADELLRRVGERLPLDDKNPPYRGPQVAPTDWKAHSDAVIAERFDRAFPVSKTERDVLAERVLLAVLRAPDFEMPERSAGVSRIDNLAAFCYRMADAMQKASKS